MITVRELIERAARATDVTTANILGPSQKIAICIVRCAIYRVAHDNGVSLNQIARRVGRHHTTIMNALSQEDVYRRINAQYDPLVTTLCNVDGKTYKFKPPIKTPRVLWTDEQMLSIDMLIRSGKTISQIAEDLGRSYEGLRSARLAWRKKIQLPSTKFWSDKRMEQVDYLVRHGHRLADIAEMWGKSRDAIASARRQWLQSIRDDAQSRPQSDPQCGSDRPDRRCRPA